MGMKIERFYVRVTFNPTVQGSIPCGPTTVIPSSGGAGARAGEGRRFEDRTGHRSNASSRIYVR